MNYIKDMYFDRENNIVVFFLQTDDEPDVWYWEVPLSEVGGNDYLEFVNDERNATLGCSVTGFDTLQDAYNYYYLGTEV